jgi:plasmid stabilization system protein ParE
VHQPRARHAFLDLAARFLNSINENIRELLVYSYRVIYRLEKRDVVIAAVIHGKRMLQ